MLAWSRGFRHILVCSGSSNVVSLLQEGYNRSHRRFMDLLLLFMKCNMAKVLSFGGMFCGRLTKLLMD